MSVKPTRAMPYNPDTDFIIRRYPTGRHQLLVTPGHYYKDIVSGLVEGADQIISSIPVPMSQTMYLSQFIACVESLEHKYNVADLRRDEKEKLLKEIDELKRENIMLRNELFRVQQYIMPERSSDRNEKAIK